MEIKRYKHNPPHVFVPNNKYFITSSIYNKIKLLSSEESKLKLIEYIKRTVENYGWKLEDWVVLNNHYHLMIESNESPETLAKIIRDIHKYSALWLKKNVTLAKKQEKIWHNYWDKCLTYESSYYTRLNYIWYNPVKHGYVDEPQQWKFGSYFYRFQEENSYVNELKMKYPFNSLKIEDDF
jgi:putative transposase